MYTASIVNVPSLPIPRNLSGMFLCVHNGLERFGEVAHAPPDLAKIPKLKGLKDQGQGKSWVRGSAGAPRGGAGETSNRKSGTLRRQRDRDEGNAKEAQKRQMEEMRQRVQEAYTGLKKKRRAGQTQYVNSEL